jgi:hypothetical protein
LRHRIDKGLIEFETAPQKYRATHDPLYWVWANIHTRCKYPSHTAWKSYGARGITVCPAWENFEQFRDDMGPTYAPGLTIERKDNNLGYCPENCEWIPRSDQSKNRRCNHRLDTPWGVLTLADAARKAKMNEATLRRRIASGMAVHVAISTPVRGGRTYHEG